MQQEGITYDSKSYTPRYFDWNFEKNQLVSAGLLHCVLGYPEVKHCVPVMCTKENLQIEQLREIIKRVVDE